MYPFLIALLVLVLVLLASHMCLELYAVRNKNPQRL